MTDLMVERRLFAPDPRKVNQIRYTLGRLYAYYRGIMDAIEAYLAHGQQSA